MSLLVPFWRSRRCFAFGTSGAVTPGARWALWQVILFVHWGGTPVDLDGVDAVVEKCFAKFGFRPKVRAAPQALRLCGEV